MSIEKTLQGIRISTIYKGYRVSRLYMGYSKTESVRLFKEYLKTIK